MKLIKTDLAGVYLIEYNEKKDIRGSFSKIYNTNSYNEVGIQFEINEHFFSVSNYGVIRGMHFQKPPFTQEKIVYVLNGKIMDVILDLRSNSGTYGKYIVIELSRECNKCIYIPKGLAHGFQSLENNTITIYLQSSIFNKDSDMGINPFSIDINWPILEYIISDKDKQLPALVDFITPF
ncbi:MAG: dTDP-4-dehydrorhamnose 3,5-epimerase family protein [Candidatus Cloacimonas sp.]|jgi:dTDP-4-dehydrorhamnose 3,5-epimerase|nr:dTDP-4-dehydrorhamnose 3,5-epimerase family protein [Candidatus Cloacimonas sp.]